MYNYDVFSSFFSDSVLQNVNDPRERKHNAGGPV